MGGVLTGHSKDVKEPIRKYGLVVVYVVVVNILCVYVESFVCIEVCSFFVES